MTVPSPFFALYDLVDKDGAVIYVGATREIAIRLRQHRATKEWWPEVDHARVMECIDLDDLRSRERQRIGDLQPRYNKVHCRLESADLGPLYADDIELSADYLERAAKVAARLYT